MKKIATHLFLFMILILPAVSARSQGYQRPEKAADDAGEGKEDRINIERSRTGVGRIKYGGGGDWYGDPSSIPNLLREFNKRTGIRTAANETVVSLLDPGLFSFPFLYMTGHGNISLDREEFVNLRGHLLAGGFLYADDNYGMDESFRSMVRELFPERELVAVSLDHPIYHSFYHLDGPPKIHEHNGSPPQGLGVFDGERLMIFYTYESDIGDGLEDPDVHGDPPGKREAAIRMAVNILYYALTE
ncbi:MAG: DUF4159 domain-containing protein [Candidatus Krumholzibacteriota bacterium]|nr:DUF4159 domain-containing protein [Candidatus Krumholzibacteriota bacterium]